MNPFAYHCPSSVAAAEKLLAEDADATLLAGGMTLLPTLKMRLAQPTALIDLGQIDVLRGVTEHGGAITIGAMTTHADVADNLQVRKTIPALASLAENIGDPQVRNRGTIGGSIANSDPAADYPAAVLALNATVITSQREIAADEFFLEMFETALQPGEIVTALRFPQPRAAAYMKFANPASRYAVAGVMVAQTDSGVRVAVTGAASCVYREAAMEAALEKNFSATALDELSLDSSEFNSDMHATQDFRAQLVHTMAQRAVLALSDG